MKKILFLLFTYYFLCSIVVAQNTFFKIYRTIEHENAYEAIQASDGSFVLVGKKAEDYTFDTVKGFALRLDNSGNLLNELILDNSNNSNFFIIDKAPDNVDQFLLMGAIDSVSNETSYSSLNICTVDINLQVLSNNTFHTLKNHRICPWKHEMVNDSILYLLIVDLISIPVPQFIVSKVKLPGDSLTSFCTEDSQICVPQDILYIPKSEKINIYYFGQLIEKQHHIKTLQLDLELNYDTSFNAPQHMLSTICSNKMNDSVYLLTATAQNPVPYVDSRTISTYKMKYNNDTIKSLKYFNHPDTILYAGFGTNTAINGTSIYITGLYNIDPGSLPWQTTPTWIQITKADLDLNIISHHFYGGDALYIPYCIITTQDGGVFITGITWNYNIPDNYQYDVFALKVDSAGTIVSVPEDATWQASEAILYPNPGNDFFIAVIGAQHNIASLALYDMSGKPVIEIMLQQDQTKVDTRHLPKGMYVYKIFNKDKPIGIGRWVKH